MATWDSDRRAEVARTQLTSLIGSGWDIEDIHASAMEIVRRVVPFDAACWATVDSDTMLFTGSITIEFEPGPALEQRFVEIESGGSDLNSFRELAGRPRPIARLSDAGPAAIEASNRFQDIWGPLGIGFEVRAAFTVADRCWAVAGLLRSQDSADFTDDDVAFLASVAPTIGAATRATLLGRPGSDPGELQGPAVLVVARDGTTRSATPAALDLLERSRQLGSAAGRFALRSVVSALGHAGATARARIHDDHLGWIVLQASPLAGGGPGDEVVVTIAPAAPRDVSVLLLDAHGLSPREREVVDAVCAGHSTTDIAGLLFISTNTVQDHLKSVFDKIGVRSRRELTAYVRGERPAPAG